MRTVAWIVALAVLWASLNGQLTGASLVAGFVVGSLVLLTMARGLDLPLPLARTRHLVGLLLFFLWELLLANLRVAWDVVTPRPRMRPSRRVSTHDGSRTTRSSRSGWPGC